MKTKNIVLVIIILLLAWFFVFRTKELNITYDSVETFGYGGVGMTGRTAMKSMAVNDAYYVTETAAADMGVSNIMSEAPLYEDDIEENAYTNGERYRENKYYRLDTEEFDNFIEDITKVVKDLNGTIKSNQQNSNRKMVFDKEFYPRYQYLEFTIDNSEVDLEKIEKTLKKWGNIRNFNSNITSIEQELTNYEQQLREMEEARKALKDSKDKDWIAKQDADLAKKSERIKNQIENAKKQSTYKTYTIDVYEVVKYRVNAMKYWYSNNYSLKNAIEQVLPDMVKLFAILIPITIMLLLLIAGFLTIYRDDRRKSFEDKVSILKRDFKNKDIHFDIKM